MKLNKLLLIAVIALSISACSGMKTQPLPPETIVVHVDIPEPASVVRPIYAVDFLTEASTDSETAKAYLSSIRAARSYSKQLEAALAPFQKAYADQQKAKSENGNSE